MTKRKLRQDTQRAVTARFPIDMYADILKEAEGRGATVADVIRSAWSHYQQEQSFNAHLLKLEKRLLRQTFEVCASVAGLSSSERNEAKSQLLSSLKGGNHHEC